MRKLFWAFALLIIAVPAFAQDSAARKSATLLYAYDLDGEAADADQIVTTANGDLLDSTTFTLTADPDVCRLVDMTVTDGNSSISAGTLTVVGTGCLGEARTCSFTFAAGGSGVKTLTCTDGESAYYKTITSVTTGALTGEGGAGVDYMSLGYTANSANGWAMYGKLVPGPMGEGVVDPFQSLDPGYLPITTSGSYSTTVTSVSSNGAFTNVSVGDLLLINYKGSVYERKVTARASADSITVNQGVNIEAAGTPFRYKKVYYSTNPMDQMYLPVEGWDEVFWNYSVDANANTGGVTYLVECTDSKQPDYPSSPWVSIATANTASAGTLAPTAVTVALQTYPYAYCRFGLKFGTGDDADSPDEDINLSVVLKKN